MTEREREILAGEKLEPRTANEQAYAKVSEPFIVTLTPTAADGSGVMDKSVGQIKWAIGNGRKVQFVFQYLDEGASSVVAPCNQVFASGASEYYYALTVNDRVDTLAVIVTGGEDDDNRAYNITQYTLTPAT